MTTCPDGVRKDLPSSVIVYHDSWSVMLVGGALAERLPSSSFSWLFGDDTVVVVGTSWDGGNCGYTSLLVVAVFVVLFNESTGTTWTCL